MRRKSCPGKCLAQFPGFWAWDNRAKRIRRAPPQWNPRIPAWGAKEPGTFTHTIAPPRIMLLCPNRRDVCIVSCRCLRRRIRKTHPLDSLGQGGTNLVSFLARDYFCRLLKITRVIP